MNDAKRQPIRRQTKKIGGRYAGLSKLLDAIHSQFMDGVSMKRLSRRHSLPLPVVENAIRMRLFRGDRPNDKLTDGGQKTHE